MAWLGATTPLHAPPVTEPIELTYALHLMPRGRISFRRWRWELWHEPHLLAAGWRTGPLHAQRALRAHAFRYVHRMHGVHPLPSQASHPAEREWGGGATSFRWGEVRVVLTPRLDSAWAAAPLSRADAP